MSDAVWLEGKEYISSKRASELSGYAQDYIGQLARKGLIDARRVGGLWHISMPSLTGYKSHAETRVPQPPEKKQSIEIDSLVSFEGKDHISAARAAQITGYHPDYVGQLARSGVIISRQVGNRWYIDREGILAHKREKDSLLGAVQAESVGLDRRSMAEGIARNTASEDAHGSRYNGPGPFLTYTRDDGDLLPIPKKAEPVLETGENKRGRSEEDVSSQEYPVPIRKIGAPVFYNRKAQGKREPRASSKVRMPAKTIYYGTFGKLAVSALTVVIVLSFGLVTLKSSSIYSTNSTQGGVIIERNMFTAGAAETLRWIGDFLENAMVKELIYKRVE